MQSAVACGQAYCGIPQPLTADLQNQISLLAGISIREQVYLPTGRQISGVLSFQLCQHVKRNLQVALVQIQHLLQAVSAVPKLLLQDVHRRIAPATSGALMKLPPALTPAMTIQLFASAQKNSD